MSFLGNNQALAAAIAILETRLAAVENANAEICKDIDEIDEYLEKQFGQGPEPGQRPEAFSPAIAEAKLRMYAVMCLLSNLSAEDAQLLPGILLKCAKLEIPTELLEAATLLEEQKQFDIMGSH